MKGLEPNEATDADHFDAYQDLQSEPYNLDVVARHVRDLMRQGLPDYQGGPLTDQQVEWIGYAYNLGYPDRRLAPGQDLSEISRQGVSNYGPDLVNKRDRIRRLLEGK